MREDPRASEQLQSLRFRAGSRSCGAHVRLTAMREEPAATKSQQAENK